MLRGLLAYGAVRSLTDSDATWRRSHAERPEAVRHGLEESVFRPLQTATREGMPNQAWRTPRAASLLQLAVLVPRLVRTYAAPTAAAAAALITSNGFGDEGTAIAGHSDPETPPGSSGRCS